VAQCALAVDASLIAFIVWRWIRRVPKDERRLLFRHVVALGVGVIALQASGFALVAARGGRALVWYGAPLVLVGALTLLVGLVDMLRWLGTSRPKPVPGEP